MKAVILAGGKGTRLRPLTQSTPKPLVPIMGTPCLGHIFSLLGRSGVTQAAVTLQFHPEKVRAWCAAAELPCEVRFFEEKEPLGTAGGVKAAEEFLGGEDFFVISGDCVCDFDLAAALERHRERGADATLLLARSPLPQEYGVVVTGADGEILRFLEKPGWSQAWTDTVNCGIYILGQRALSMIPAGVPYDFSRDLFPRMLSSGLRLYGDAPAGYWCDIGDVDAYRRCHCDILEGRADIEFDRRCLVTKPRALNGAMVLPPSYIDKNCVVEAGAVIGPLAVMTRGCVADEGAVLRECVLQERASVGAGGCAHGAVLCEGAAVGERAAAYRGSILGAGSRLEPGALLAPGGRLAPGASVPAGETATGAWRRGGELFAGVLGEDFSLSRCVELGLAAGGAEKRFVVMHGGGVAARAAECLASGLRAVGSHVVEGGEGFEAQLMWAAAELDCDGGVFAESDGRLGVRLRFVTGEGAPLTRAEERRLRTALRDGTPPPLAQTEQPAVTHKLRRLYREALQEAAGSLRGVSVVAEGRDAPAETLRCALTVADATLERSGRKGVISLRCDPRGRKLEVQDEAGEPMTDNEARLLLCRERLQAGEPVAVFYAFPHAVEADGDDMILRVLSEPADSSDAEARQRMKREHFMKDALFCALELLRLLKEKKKKLSELRRELPACAVRRARVTARPDRMTRVMGRLCEGCDPRGLREGVELRRGGGRVLVTPRLGTEFLIQAEAARAETAEELCGDMQRELEALLREGDARDGER